MDKFLNVDSYFQRFFRADTTLADAREEVDTWSPEQDAEKNRFSSLEDAQEWFRRVELWHGNLRRDLHLDSVPAPALDSGRWLLFGPAVQDVREPEDTLRCWLCRKCKDV